MSTIEDIRQIESQLQKVVTSAEIAVRDQQRIENQRATERQALKDLGYEGNPKEILAQLTQDETELQGKLGQLQTEVSELVREIE